MKEEKFLINILKNILTYFVVIVLMLGAEFLFIRYLEEQNLNALKTAEANTVLKASSGLSEGVRQGLLVIEFLRNDNRVISYVDDPSDINKLAVKQLIGNLSNVTALYDQIRILDMTGMEVVRVDYENEYASPLVVPDQDLQDKSSRDYFPICRDLAKGGIYISRLDLNIENKKIEIPYKPVVRICTPLSDSQGEKQEILILNFNATQMLEQFSALSNNLMLVNIDGYWLVSPDPQDEWAFMFESDVSFKNRYPQEWDSISSIEDGQFVDQKGLWTYTTIYPLEDLTMQNTQIFHESYFNDIYVSKVPQYAWKIISYLSENYLKESRRETALPIILVSFIFYPITLIGIWGINQRRKIKNQESQRIRYLATHDGMTGLYNKAFLEAEIERLNLGRSYPVSIIMIDANNLKTINDTFGHQAGDQMLKNIGAILRESFRTEDILARIGGDEFAVVLPLTNIDESKKIISRFSEDVQKFNLTDSFIKVDVAIGCATSNEKEDLKAVIKRADEEMYQDKALQKERGKRSD